MLAEDIFAQFVIILLPLFLNYFLVLVNPIKGLEIVGNSSLIYYEPAEDDQIGRNIYTGKEKDCFFGVLE